MDTSIGVNLRVTAHSNQGGRKYMEDIFSVAYQPTTDEKDLLYAYFGIFDGHGGSEAAVYAKAHLMDYIVSQKNFWADDDESVLRSIKEGFSNAHYAMWRELDKWPKTKSGFNSTAGTTASVAFVRRGKLYVGHVGDSRIVLGYQDPNSPYWIARLLTTDHKPESTKEHSRIQKSGGKVSYKSGVPRVVWNRPRIGYQGNLGGSTLIDEIPLLAVARSLGDFWSFNSELNEFVVSPVPDTHVYDIDVRTHRCLILGSDGLWDMVCAQDAVNSVYLAEMNNARLQKVSATECTTSLTGSLKNWINPSKSLVGNALNRWYSNKLLADNTSAVTVVIGLPTTERHVTIRTANSAEQRSLPQVQDASLHASPSTYPVTDNTDDLDKSPSTRRSLGRTVSLSQLASLRLPKVTTKSAHRSPQSQIGESTVAAHKIPRSITHPKSSQGVSNKHLKQHNAVCSAKKKTSVELRSARVPVSLETQPYGKQKASKRLSAKREKHEVPSATKAVKKGGFDDEKSIPKMGITPIAKRVTRSMIK